MYLCVVSRVSRLVGMGNNRSHWGLTQLVSVCKSWHISRLERADGEGKPGWKNLLENTYMRANNFFGAYNYIYLSLSLSFPHPLSLHLTTYTSYSQLSTHFAVVGKIYSFSRGFPLPPPSLYLSLFHPALPDIHFSQLPWILHGTPRSLARSTFALYPLFSPGGTRRTTKLTDSDCHSSSSSLPSIRVQTECVWARSPLIRLFWRIVIIIRLL